MREFGISRRPCILDDLGGDYWINKQTRHFSSINVWLIRCPLMQNSILTDAEQRSINISRFLSVNGWKNHRGCKIIPDCLNSRGLAELAPASLCNQPQPTKSAILAKIGIKTRDSLFPIFCPCCFASSSLWGNNKLDLPVWKVRRWTIFRTKSV